MTKNKIIVNQTNNNERLIRAKDLYPIVGLTRSTIARLRRDGKFPAPIHFLGNRHVAWRMSDLQAWIAERGS